MGYSHLGTKIPDALTPNCSATPNGASSKPDISYALSSGIASNQPFFISFWKVSAKFVE